METRDPRLRRRAETAATAPAAAVTPVASVVASEVTSETVPAASAVASVADFACQTALGKVESLDLYESALLDKEPAKIRDLEDALAAQKAETTRASAQVVRLGTEKANLERNLARLLATARNQLQTRDHAIEALRAKLGELPTGPDPASLPPRNIRFIRAKLGVELEFETLEHVGAWLSRVGLRINPSDGLPVLPAELAALNARKAAPDDLRLCPESLLAGPSAARPSADPVATDRRRPSTADDARPFIATADARRPVPGSPEEAVAPRRAAETIWEQRRRLAKKPTTLVSPIAETPTSTATNWRPGPPKDKSASQPHPTVASPESAEAEVHPSSALEDKCSRRAGPSPKDSRMQPSTKEPISKERREQSREPRRRQREERSRSRQLSGRSERSTGSGTRSGSKRLEDGEIQRKGRDRRRDEPRKRSGHRDPRDRRLPPSRPHQSPKKDRRHGSREARDSDRRRGKTPPLKEYRRRRSPEEPRKRRSPPKEARPPPPPKRPRKSRSPLPAEFVIADACAEEDGELSASPKMESAPAPPTPPSQDDDHDGTLSDAATETGGEEGSPCPENGSQRRASLLRSCRGLLGPAANGTPLSPMRGEKGDLERLRSGGLGGLVRPSPSDEDWADWERLTPSLSPAFVTPLKLRPPPAGARLLLSPRVSVSRLPPHPPNVSPLCLRRGDEPDDLRHALSSLVRDLSAQQSPTPSESPPKTPGRGLGFATPEKVPTVPGAEGD